MKPIDLRHVYKKHKGLWVALINDTKVISADKSVRNVVEQAKKKGYQNPLLFKVPKNDLPFVGFASSLWYAPGTRFLTALLMIPSFCVPTFRARFATRRA